MLLSMNPTVLPSVCKIFLSDNYCYAFVSYLALTAQYYNSTKIFSKYVCIQNQYIIIDFYSNIITLHIAVLYTRVCSRSKSCVTTRVISVRQSLTALTSHARLSWFKMNKILNFLFTTICFFFFRVALTLLHCLFVYVFVYFFMQYVQLCV